MKVSILAFLIGLYCNQATARDYPEEVEAFISGSVESLQLQTDAHSQRWGLSKAVSWNVDQEKGIIFWVLGNDTYAVAPVQIIGTYNPSDNTFLWAWDHPSILDPLKEHAKFVRDYGRKHNVDILTKRKVVVSEAEAWEFTALASRLANANGGYRGNGGGPLVFMTFGEIKLGKNAP